MSHAGEPLSEPSGCPIAGSAHDVHIYTERFQRGWDGSNRGFRPRQKPPETLALVEQKCLAAFGHEMQSSNRPDSGKPGSGL